MFRFIEKILKGSPFALYITDAHAQVLQLRAADRQFEIFAAGQETFDEGTVVNGEIMQPDNFAHSVKNLLAKTGPHKLKQTECIVSLPESQSYGKIFHMPAGLKNSQLKDVLDAKIAETIPVLFFDLVYDFTVYALGQIQVVFVVAARKTVIEQYNNVLKERCGLHPVAIEPESLSLVRNMPLKFDPNEGLVLIHANGETIKWFSFWSGLLFDSNVISIKKEEQNISEALADDLKKSIDFFQEATKQNIGRIFIAGSKDNILSLEQILKSQFSVPVEVLRQYRVNMDEFCVAAGAALRAAERTEAKQLNLLKI